MSARTEAPTPRRKQQARKKGDVARSRLLAQALGAAVGLAALGMAAPERAQAFAAFTRRLLEAGLAGEVGPDEALPLALRALAQACLPVLLAAFAGAVLGAVVQTGLLWTPSALALRLDRLSPKQGIKRLVGSEGLGEILRCAVVGLFALGLAYAALRAQAATVARLASASPGAAALAAIELTRSLAWRVALALLVLGLFDLLWQRHRHQKRLRMTREEVLREHRESEGDPQARARRKALHRALLSGSPARGVARATAVVVNPTHLAVALRYDPSEAPAPVLVAKGRGAAAARIRSLALRMRVPVVRDVPLARALYPFDLGEEIPEELYEAAAAVLRRVLALDPACADPAPGRRGA